MYLRLRQFTKLLYRFSGTGLPRIADYIRRIISKRNLSRPVVIDDFFIDKEEIIKVSTGQAFIIKR
jgi:hypothetical protein